MKYIEKYVGGLSTLLLILLGPISVAIAIGDVTGLHLSDKGTLHVVLGVVGVLCLAIGLERIVENQRFERRIRLLEDSLRNLAGGIQLDSYDAIYDNATRLCCIMRRRLRAVVFASGPKAPVKYTEVIAERLAELTKSGIQATYQVVLACDVERLPSDFIDKNEKRLALYTGKNVTGQVELFILDAKPSIGLDVLIVDTDHVHLSLATSAGSSQFQSGIVFENQPKLASVFVDWFERVILTDAEPYESFKKKLTSKGRDS